MNRQANRVSARRSFPLPIGVLSRVFRGKFAADFVALSIEVSFRFHDELLPLAQPRAFVAWLRVLFRHDWVVYSKRLFGGPEHVLRCLGAYTHESPFPTPGWLLSPMATSLCRPSPREADS